MLRESLLRFVAARTKNAGRQRVLCALIGGIGTGLLALAPILASILGGKPRALRLAALPLLWLGATIFFSSIHGICFIIYLLGDARQLHPFELARPPISSPRPLNSPGPIHIPPAISGFTLGHAYTASTSSAGSMSMKEKTYPVRGPSMANGALLPATPPGIIVSSPFPESPSVLPPSVTAPPRAYHSRNISTSNTSAMSIPAIPPYSPALSSPFDTAPFITPFDPSVLHQNAAQIAKQAPWHASQSTLPSFNFDELPGRRRVIPPQRSSSFNAPPPEPITSRLKRFAMRFVPGPSNPRTASTPLIAPLTRVWSPLITRAQWEIVMRSSMAGLMFASVVVGALLAVPVRQPGQSWYDGYTDLGI